MRTSTRVAKRGLARIKPIRWNGHLIMPGSSQETWKVGCYYRAATAAERPTWQPPSPTPPLTLGVPTLFLTVPDLLDNLRFSYDSEDTNFEQRFDEIRNAKLLVLDDFGTQNATAWAQEKLFQIINYRYINRLPLVVTTNLDINEIEPRIRSRLVDPQLVSKIIISTPDYRNPTDDKGHPDLSSLDLHAKHTFASFEDRRDEGLTANEIKSLEKAIKTATSFAARPHGWLVLTGPYGCGKTYLAAAIANSLADRGQIALCSS